MTIEDENSCRSVPQRNFTIEANNVHVGPNNRLLSLALLVFIANGLAA
jgi:hypothetical protein